MKSFLTHDRSPGKNYINLWRLGCLCLFLSTFGSGCTSPDPKIWPQTFDGSDLAPLDAHNPKSLFVFLDGTANAPDSATNVYRLFNLISENNDPMTKSIYLEGVGTRDSLFTITGMILGLGMEERILMGYEFLALHYHPGDRIYIFGFSRGAHQARALAGLLAYSGLPKVSPKDRDRLMKIGNKILELTKEKNDSDYVQQWSGWTLDQPPLLSQEIKERLDIEVQPVEITFLGIWDTVPGSFFKTYDRCKEKKDRKEGDRYKSGSYPPIRHIAHAISLDEKRSKFRQLLACEPYNSTFTTIIDEVWFPGAHADVGGGYGDPDSLPGISLNWMLHRLAKSYKFKNEGVPQVPENARGIAHWSIGDFPGNLGSDCEDRPYLPSFSSDQIHPSFHARKNASPVPLNNEKNLQGYPILCSDE